VWPKRLPKAKQIEQQLTVFSAKQIPLHGITRDEARKALALQMVASLRRIDYTKLRTGRRIDLRRTDPNHSLFDPELAATLHLRNGDLDEAFWIIFLATHFGKHGHHGRKRLKDVYSGLGQKTWTWKEVSANPDAFRRWLAGNASRVGGAFSNHRKYETLRSDSQKGTAAVIESYLAWIGPELSHRQLLARIIKGGNDPHANFDSIYKSMRVKRFGRLGKFDFLALVGRLDLAPIAPGSAYLKGATGPLRGARLLFGGRVDAAIGPDQLQEHLTKLDGVLKVGMQVMEDSLCNWQKSPSKFVPFKG
jgi:hypothetical protein